MFRAFLFLGLFLLGASPALAQQPDQAASERFISAFTQYQRAGDVEKLFSLFNADAASRQSAGIIRKMLTNLTHSTLKSAKLIPLETMECCTQDDKGRYIGMTYNTSTQWVFALPPAYSLEVEYENTALKAKGSESYLVAKQGDNLVGVIGDFKNSLNFDQVTPTLYEKPSSPEELMHSFAYYLKAGDVDGLQALFAEKGERTIIYAFEIKGTSVSEVGFSPLIKDGGDATTRVDIVLSFPPQGDPLQDLIHTNMNIGIGAKDGRYYLIETMF